MTNLSHKKYVEQARKRWDKASKALCDWAIANGHGHTKRSALIGVAPAELIAAEAITHTAWQAAEDAAVAAGKAWRGTLNLLNWYR